MSRKDHDEGDDAMPLEEQEAEVEGEQQEACCEEERPRPSRPQHDRADGPDSDEDQRANDGPGSGSGDDGGVADGRGGDGVAGDDDVTQQRGPFTISDMVATMNDTMRSAVGADGDRGSGGDYPKVELCRRDAGGRTTGMDEADMKATDLRCKIGKAADEVTLLDTPEERIEWATARRLEGNRLFALGEYREAMDVYTTCLVAIDQGGPGGGDGDGAGSGPSPPPSADEGGGVGAAKVDPATGSDIDDDRRHRAQTEREIKLPVLLNLAACSMKLGQYRKAEQFCTVAIDETPTSQCGKQSVKAWYRRGKARMQLGIYGKAEKDYREALATASSEEERRTIERDLTKLASLVAAAKVNQRKCKKAMRTVFAEGGTNETAALYDVGRQRTHSSLVAQPKHSTPESRPRGEAHVRRGESESESGGGNMSTISEVGVVGWAVSIVSRCLRRLLSGSMQTQGGDDEERSLLRADKVKQN